LFDKRLAPEALRVTEQIKSSRKAASVNFLALLIL
jgi:hypothetical protein